VGGQRHEHDSNDHERGSTRSGGVTENKRNSRNEERFRARVLAPFTHDARSGTRELPTAAAAIEATTVAEIAA